MLKNENTLKKIAYNILKTKIILNIKMSAKGGPDFTWSLPGGRLPLPLISYATAYKFHGFIIFPLALARYGMLP